MKLLFKQVLVVLGVLSIFFISTNVLMQKKGTTFDNQKNELLNTAAVINTATDTSTKTESKVDPAISKPVGIETSVVTKQVLPVSKNSEGVFSGILDIYHADTFSKNQTSKAVIMYNLLTDEGKMIPLMFSGKDKKMTEENPMNHTRVTIRGILKEDNGMLSVNSITPDSSRKVDTRMMSGGRASATNNYRQYKIATILFSFSNTVNAFYPKETARHALYDVTPGDVDSVAGYFFENSYGQLRLVGKNSTDGTNDIYGWYTLPYNNLSCNQSNVLLWTQAALTNAIEQGFDPTGYDTIVFGTDVPNCGFGGFYHLMAIPGYGNIKSVVNVSNFFSQNFAHELGHAMTLSHSNALDCVAADGVTPVAYSYNSGTCISIEYGDHFDVMGSGPYRHFNNFQKEKLGFIPSVNIKTIDRSSVGGTFDLYPQEDTPTGVRLSSIKIIPYDPKFSLWGIFDSYLTLEYRKPFGVWDNFSLTDPVVNGVTLRYKTNTYSSSSPGGIGFTSSIIDAHPNTSTFDDAPLAIGETYLDKASTRKIKILSLSPIKTTISISDPVCLRRRPAYRIDDSSFGDYEIPIIPSDNGSYNIDVSITNTDSVQCLPANFLVPSKVSINPVASNPVLTNQQIVLSPGQSQSVSIEFEPSPSLSAGLYSLYINGPLSNYIKEIDSGLDGVHSIFSSTLQQFSVPTSQSFKYDRKLGSCVRNAPTVTFSPTNVTFTNQTQTQTISYTVTNNDTADCGTLTATLKNRDSLNKFTPAPFGATLSSVSITPGASASGQFQLGLLSNATLPAQFKFSVEYSGRYLHLKEILRSYTINAN